MHGVVQSLSIWREGWVWKQMWKHLQWLCDSTENSLRAESWKIRDAS